MPPDERSPSPVEPQRPPPPVAPLASRDTSRAGDSESLADRPAAGAQANPPQTAVPEMFGRYRILKTLGQGAMGAVFLAEDTQLHRRVALKIPKFAEHPGKNLLERFYREARAAAMLRHAHICPVYDVGEINGTHYLTMAFIEGKPLSEVVKKSKSLTERQAAGVIRKLALGLHEAHAHGVVHRDLKPANIMIDRKGEPVVTDFGLARQEEKEDESRLTQTGAILGTPAYMSPEQVEADPAKIGPASDVYSLGVILYELLTGRLPFQGPVTSVLAQIISKTPERPTAVRPGLDPALEAICLKMMARSTAERYASMAEVAQALTDWVRGSASGKSGEITAAGDTAATQVAPATDNEDRLASLLLRESAEEIPLAVPLLRRQTAAIRPAPSRDWRKLAIAGAAIAIVVLFGIILLMQTPKGTVEIELSDPAARVEAKVDGNVVTVTGAGQPLRLEVGEHELVISGEGFEAVTRSFTVKKGNNPVMRIALVPVKPRGPRGGQKPTTGQVAAGTVPKANSAVTPPGEEVVFNGRDLTGWRVMATSGPDDDRHFPVANDGRWMVANGELICLSSQNDWLKYERDLDNFVLSLEYKLPAKGNTGIYVRCPVTGHLSREGMEIQVLDDAGHPGLKPTGRTGAIQNVYAPMSSPIKPAGEWNAMEITCDGDRVQVAINGTRVVDADMGQLESLKGRPRSGFIGLSNWHGLAKGVAFRNLRVRPLAAAASSAKNNDAAAAPARQLAPLAPFPRDQWVALEPPANLSRMNWIHEPRFEGGVLDFRSTGGGFDFSRPSTFENGVLRARIRIIEGDLNAGLLIRKSDEGFYYAFLNLAGRVTLGYGGKTPGMEILGQSAADFRPSEFVELQVSAIGDHLVVSANGKNVIDVTDGRLKRGVAGVNAFKCRAQFQNLEIKLLEDSKTSALPAAAAAPAVAAPAAPRLAPIANANFPQNRWQPVDFPDITKFNWLKNPRVEENQIAFRSDGGGFGLPALPLMKNCAIRVKVKPLTQGGNVGLSLRDGPDLGYYAFYGASGSDAWIGIGWTDPKTGKFAEVGGKQPVHFKPLKDFFEFEFSAVGDLLTVKANGRKMYEVRDSRAACGLFGINAFQCRAQFKDLEVKSLDAPSAAEKAVLSLAKDAAQWRGSARILQQKFSDWPNSKTDYARFEDPLIEVGLGSEAPGWGWGATGLEIDNVERIKFTLATGGIFKRVGDDGVDCGFKIDYHTPAGYTKRVALSLWNTTPSKYVPVPQWGRAALPDQVEKIGLHSAYDLDLARWAPNDWDGKIWFNVMTQNTGNGSRLQVKLVELEARDKRG